MSASLKKYYELSQQVMNIMEERHIFARDLDVVRGQLSKLKECFTRYKENHMELAEKLMKVHDLAYNRELQLREKKEELAATKVEIESLRG